MRSLIFLFLILIYSSLSFGVQKTILITAFEPFGYSKINRSLDVANSIKKNLEKNGFVVNICILPVVYDIAAKRAKECYESSKIKPSMVISLGEGGCSLRLETAAQNRDSTPGFPDNAGKIRAGTAIDKDAPPSLSFRSFVADMYCAAPLDEKKEIVVSESPGGFVCNNTAFHLGNYFSKLNIPYTFIHVPNNKCSEDSNLAISTGIQISNMINALALFKPQKRSNSFEDICKNLPMSVKQAEDFEKIIAINEMGLKKQCGAEFVQKLKERLKQWKEKDSTY